MIRRVDPEIKRGRQYNLSTLKTIFIAGEHCDMETKHWIEKTFKVAVLNHWWQTETGSAITGTCVGLDQSLNPPNFSTGLPYCGYDGKIIKIHKLITTITTVYACLVRVLHPNGTEAKPNELGRIVVKLPLPPGNMSSLFRNDELFERVYFQKYPVCTLKTSREKNTILF